MKSKRNTIGQLAKTTGCNKETIRYYEKIGVMFSPPRTEGGHRLYDDTATKRLLFIRRTRELGFSLAQVRQLLALVDDHDYTCAEVRSFTTKHVEEIREKIADLKTIEKSLADMVSRCTGGRAPDCAVIDALFGENKS